MRVGSEPCSGCNAVFIDYAQRSEEFVLRILIAGGMSQNFDLTVTEGKKGTYLPAEKVWNALSQLRSALPRSSLFLVVNFKEPMLSVTVDRFLEMTARGWTRRLALESLSSVDRLGFGNEFEEDSDGYLYGNEDDVKEKRRFGWHD